MQTDQINCLKLLEIWDFGAGYFGNIIKWNFGFDYGDVSVFGVYAGDHARYGVIGIGPIKSHCYHHAFLTSPSFRDSRSAASPINSRLGSTTRFLASTIA